MRDYRPQEQVRINSQRGLQPQPETQETGNHSNDANGTGREIRASFEREDGANVNGLDTEFPDFVSFTPRILKQSLSLSCSLVGL